MQSLMTFETLNVLLPLVIAPAKKHKWDWCLEKFQIGLDKSIDIVIWYINVLKSDVSVLELLPEMNTLCFTS